MVSHSGCGSRRVTGWTLHGIVLPVVAFVCTLIAQPCLGAVSSDTQNSGAGSNREDETLPLPDLDVPVLLKRWDEVETELHRLGLRERFVPASERSGQVLALIEFAQLNLTRGSPSRGARSFLGCLVLVNLTQAPIAVVRSGIRLIADGTEIPRGSPSNDMRASVVRVKDRTFHLRNAEPSESLKIPAGDAKATWIAFTGLTPDDTVPQLALKIRVGEQDVTLNVNEFRRGALRLGSQRIGPHDCLALLTISGELDGINLGSLVDDVDGLIQQGVSRLVLCWTKTAQPVDRLLAAWLRQNAMGSRRNRAQFSLFPPLPASLEDIHLAAMRELTPRRTVSVTETFSRYDRLASSGVREHATCSDAVLAALWGVYETMPRDELVREIRRASGLSCAAALAAGGARLTSRQLPLILKKSDDTNPEVQQAALMALRHFGETEALDKLAHYARTGREPLVPVAVESLADSPFPEAQARLLTLLKDTGFSSQENVVRVLSRSPKVAWSENLYQIACDHDHPACADAIQFLLKTGHPKAVTVLKAALQSGNAELSEMTFRELEGRTDEECHAALRDFTLSYLEDSPPTSAMQAFLNRTKEFGAVPLLLKHLADPDEERTALINTLALLGDESVAAAIESAYPKLRDNERIAALTALRELRSPAFETLASNALKSGKPVLVRAACQALRADGSDSSVRLLIETLGQSNDKTVWPYLCNLLATTGSAEARVALRRGCLEDDLHKRKCARDALRSLERHSPGHAFAEQGRHQLSLKEWNKASSYFSLALEIDPELSSVYADRGNCHLQLDDLTAAKRDFERAVELDSADAMGVTGLAITQVLEGDCAAGIALVAEAAQRFANDASFSYNAACVYARAAELDTNAGADARRGEYVKKAISHLKAAVKRGFKDFEWMRQDRDLESLHGLSEFEQLFPEA